MAKKDDHLFEESSQGAVSALTGFFLLIAFVLSFGGLVLAGYAFGADVPATELWVGGLLLACFGFAIPFTLIPLSGK